MVDIKCICKMKCKMKTSSRPTSERLESQPVTNHLYLASLPPARLHMYSRQSIDKTLLVPCKLHGICEPTSSFVFTTHVYHLHGVGIYFTHILHNSVPTVCLLHANLYLSRFLIIWSNCRRCSCRYKSNEWWYQWPSDLVKSIPKFYHDRTLHYNVIARKLP